MNVTRVLRGDFAPSRNETRRAPIDLGTVNVTRVRRCVFFPSRKEAASLRFPIMMIRSGGGGLSGRLIRLKRATIPSAPIDLSMAHTISLGAALLIILLAFVFLFLVGPLGLLFLIVAAILLWYAFGPGANRVVISN
jgi:hypothetical protein